MLRRMKLNLSRLWYPFPRRRWGAGIGEWKILGECMLPFQFEDLAMRVILIGPRRIAR
jgi:hypothetical protein